MGVAEAEVVEGDLLLEQGVGADGDGDGAVGQSAQPGGSPFPVAANQERDRHARLFEIGSQAFAVLAREDFGRRHQGGLEAGVDGRAHGQ